MLGNGEAFIGAMGSINRQIDHNILAVVLARAKFQ
jgi:hypothetical protein